MESTSIYFIILVLLALLLYIFPFLPALYEWKNKTDAQPFLVNFQDRTLVDYDIRLFREYIHSNFASVLKKYSEDASSLNNFNQNEKYYITGKKEILQLEETLFNISDIVLFNTNGVLPQGINFGNKVYSSGDLKTGAYNTFTEIYSEQDLFLTNNNVVTKLIYSGNNLTIEAPAQLQGFAKAKNKIHFSGSAKFQYLHAPIIEFGLVISSPKVALDIIGANLPRTITEEHLIIPDNTELKQNLVVKAPLNIGENCEITGNIKCYQNIQIGNNSLIMGSVFCSKNIEIGDNCYIQGPIVSHLTIKIGTNCFIGSSDALTSIVANDIYIAQGSCATGQILAKNHGVCTILT